MAFSTATFEAGVNGNTITTASGEASATAWDTVDTSGGTITYDNTHAYGALSGKIVPDGSAAETTLQWSTAFGTNTDHYGRIYVWFDTNPGVADLRLVHGLSGASSAYRIDLGRSGGADPGKLHIYEQGGSFVASTTNVISLGQWVRVEWHVIHSTTVGQIELKLFNDPDSSSPTETKTTAANRNTLSSSDAIRFGKGSGAASTGTFWLENIVADATSYPGSAIEPTFVPSQPALRW